MALFFVLPVLQAKEKTFTVVIDAGHGGKDPGARGTIINEKVINLAVALKLGSLISEKHPDVKVVYTRKTDVFIELDERANIANRNKADLFISIHTNAVKRGSAVTGTETYTLGLARTDENLEVAMRENSAILLEDNYLQKYEGFDPNSSESYIIFEFMQNKHMEQSISLASEVQKSFSAAKRVNRGVRQAGFLVLRKTSMPSILVELGYISNSTEERFLASSAGQQKLATSIYNAFTKYKWEYDRKRGALANSGTVAPGLMPVDDGGISVSKPKVEHLSAPAGSEEDIRQRRAAATESASPKQAVAAEKTTSVRQPAKGQRIFKVQILTSDKKLSPGSKLFKGYKDVDFYVEKGIYKYTYGETTSFDEIKKIRRKVAKDFKDAFIVAFRDGKKVKY
nr:N-acetylmuramoyl-L-alanine amidase [Parabacteroides sp. AM08-6]